MKKKKKILKVSFFRKIGPSTLSVNIGWSTIRFRASKRNACRINNSELANWKTATGKCHCKDYIGCNLYSEEELNVTIMVTVCGNINYFHSLCSSWPRKLLHIHISWLYLYALVNPHELKTETKRKRWKSKCQISKNEKRNSFSSVCAIAWSRIINSSNIFALAFFCFRFFI